MPRGAASLRLVPPVPVAPEPVLKFQWERFAAIARELPPLFLRHWEEIALNRDSVPLDPNWPEYYRLDIAGVLRCLTVRTESGTLAGYHFVLIFPHLHYASTLWAQSDMFWLDPAYRAGWWGVKLLSVVRDQLRAAGVKVHFVNIKLHFEADRGTLAKVLRRLGYRHTENTFGITF